MRLSIDFDLKSSRYLDVLMAYFNMRYFFKKIFVITTMHGIHLRAYPEKDIDLFVYRGMFKDDEIRLELDMEREYIHHVDFFSKKGNRNYLSTEEEVLDLWVRKVLRRGLED